jgi:hypothetical protein
MFNGEFGLFTYHGNHSNQVLYCRQQDNHGNQVGLDCLCTMATKLFTLGNYGNYGNQLVYCRAKDDLKVLLALGMKDPWISFEPLGRS